jgi:hypothetical protein
MTPRRGLITTALVALAAQQAGAQATARLNKYGYPEKHAPRPTSQAITPEDLETRLYIFADDSMQGRAFGRIGNMRGTNYIASEVKRLGLLPAGDNGTYFQRLPVFQRHFTDKSTITVDGTTLRFNTDFVPTPTPRAPKAISNTQVVYGGSLADTSSLISPDAAAGKFVIFASTADATGGRGGRGGAPGANTGNPCLAILNPSMAGNAGRGGFGFGGGANVLGRYGNAAAIGLIDLDQTPMGRRPFMNEPTGQLDLAKGPPNTPRAPIVVNRNGQIGTLENGQVGGHLPNGMTAAQLQQQIDSARADSIGRLRRSAMYGAQESVRACATQDSIAVSHGAASMMGPGGIAAADSAAMARLGGVGGGRGGAGGGRGAGGRGGAGGNNGEAPAAQIHLTNAAAEKLLGRSAMGMTAGTAGKTVSANLAWEEKDVGDWARNVVAIVPGSDPALKGEYVLVSAHNDHVGFNTTPVDHDSLKAYNDARMRIQMSKKVGDLVPATAAELAGIHVNMDSLRKIRPARLDSINNGADDDGSGSMGILEIAEYIAKMPVKPKRTTLFVWQTGEEAGLLGSQYFATHPTVPVDSITADINIDMIGRGRAEDIPGGGPTYVGVVGSGFMSSELAEIIASANLRQKQPLALDPKFDLPTTWPGYNNIYGRSDHFNYARQCIPIAFFFTGLHGDYHQRTDEPQYIDYPHYSMIANMVKDAIVDLGNRPQRVQLDKPCLR